MASCILWPLHIPPDFYVLLPHPLCVLSNSSGCYARASFLRHLTFIVYFLLPFVLRSSVYCLPLVLFCHMSVLLWLHQLRERACHHHKTVATPHSCGYLIRQHFTTKFTSVMTPRVRLLRSETETFLYQYLISKV